LKLSVNLVLMICLECFCGNTLAAGSVAATDGRCNMVCAGNATEYCGGPNGISLYQYVPPRSDVLFNNATFANSSSTSISSTIPTTSSTASPTPTGPSVLQTVGQYSHMDCYNEPTAGRALTGKLVASDDMTPQYCAGNCTSLGYIYMGLEYARECFCGNSLASTSTVNTAGKCNTVCAGNGNYYCGGSSALNVYTINTNATTSNSTATSSLAVSSTLSTLASSTMASSSVAPTVTTLSTLTASASSTITNSTTSTSTTSSAAATSSSPWTYYGCANETAGRALSSAATAAPDMTIEKCQSFCLSNSLPVAGVEYSTECFCGTGLNPGSAVNQTGCSMPCGGNSAQTCGGPSRLSVYKYNGTLVAPSNPETIGTYNFQGCYSEPTTGGRALPSYSFVNATAMSAEFCVGGCSAKGYAYAGAEYGKECWCANALNTASTALATTSCNMLCAGNKYEYCGTGGKLSIWKRG
jgi:WSC domain